MTVKVDSGLLKNLLLKGAAAFSGIGNIAISAASIQRMNFIWFDANPSGMIASMNRFSDLNEIAKSIELKKDAGTPKWLCTCQLLQDEDKAHFGIWEGWVEGSTKFLTQRIGANRVCEKATDTFKVDCKSCTCAKNQSGRARGIVKGAQE